MATEQRIEKLLKESPLAKQFAACVELLAIKWLFGHPDPAPTGLPGTGARDNAWRDTARSCWLTYHWSAANNNHDWRMP